MYTGLHMRTLIVRFVILAAIASLAAPLFAEALPKARPEEVGLSTERLARIDAVVKEYIASKQIAGAVTLVARHGKLAHLSAHGMADIEASRPMAADTIFRIASMTKPVTSVAAMMLYEEGKFLLSDPVGDYIPEFAQMSVLPGENATNNYRVPARRPITVRNLLTHTSGLTYQWNPRLGGVYRDYGITHGLIQDPSTILEKMKVLAGLPLLNQPGEKWEYGLSTDVLGALVQMWSGMPLDEFFRTRIFEPLGMKDTQFYLSADQVKRIAAVYSRAAGKPIERVGTEPIEQGNLVYSTTYPYTGPRTYFSGGGGLTSTASDYARFAQMLANGGELDGVRLLSPRTVKFIASDHLATIAAEAPHGFGLGFAVARAGKDLTELTSPGTYGWGGFWYTVFFVDPAEDMIGVFMCQLYPANGVDVLDKFPVLARQAIIE